MLSPMRHPVFGQLVPDQWGQSLMTFRVFPHLKAFWLSEPDGTAGPRDAKRRKWVADWEHHIADLAKVCRNIDVMAGLQARGVYEVHVNVPKNGEPSAEQAATYQAFLDHEAAVCRNVADALLRYYRHGRQVLSDWFREDDDWPPGDTIEGLAPRVRFDGITINRRAAHGVCPITLGWDPDWDPEHGLSMTLYRDQVLDIGPAGEGLLAMDPEDYRTADYLVWGPDQLNAAERAALDEFVAGYEGYREE